PMALSVELHARVSGPLPLSRWRWRVVNTAGQQVFTQDGKGAAPELYVWQIPAELKRDARYEALLSVTDVGGDTAWSRAIPIGLGFGLPGADKRKRRTRINAVNGRLFVDDGATPTPRLRSWFNDRLARLRGEQDLMVEMFVYGAPKVKAKAKNALAWTQRRARTLEGILLASGVDRERFVVQAMGNLRKLAPERNEKMARLNRRIELRFRLRSKEHPPLSPEVQPVASLIVNGSAVVLNKQGVGEAKVKVPVGHFLRVDAVFASGARSVLRRLRHPDGLSARAVVLQGSGVVVSGKLRGERSLRVGDQDIDLSALSVRLRPMMVAVALDPNGNGLAVVGEEASKTACLGMCFGTSSDMVMQGWELRLFAEASDKPRANSNDKATLRRKIHTITGVGPVPPVLNWDGKNAQGAFILRQGVYSARLIARGKGGFVGLSRPIHFRAYRPQEDFRVLLADPFGSLKRKSKLPAMKLSADGKRDFERFMKLAARVSGSIEITGHVDVRLRASQALVMSRSMAESLRDAMVAKGIDAGRIMLRGEGSSNRLIMRAKNQADHAKNRRVELLLRSDELPELPALRNASARLHSPNGDLLAQRDGTLQGELFPDASGKIMVQVLDGSGRAAQVPLNLEAQTKLEEMELVLVLPALTADGAAMIETDATSLRVQLPAEGAVLSSANLGIFGSVLAGVRVRINGKSVQVHPLSGRFGAALTLAEGEQELLVEAEDAQGHRARVRRKVRVVPSGRFLMAVADLGYQTVAAQLPGLRADRSYDIGAYGRVGGRAMVWFKERWDLGDSSFFKKLELNAYLDTDRVYGEFKEFSRDDLSLRLLPPEFGDEAKEVQEIQAAGPIFLDLKADDSRFRFANFKTALPGRELLKYSRSFYGLDLLFDRKFGDVKKPERVQAQLYLSDTAAGLRSASNLLRGTGSSFYRLRHRDLLPGSDQVRLVVRDAANGLLLFERNMQRGVDYRIDAVEGLLILTQPLASTAGTQMASAYGVSTADLGGHPVFLHVAYTHRDDERLASFAAGGRVDGASKKLGVKGGVSYAFEGRADGGSAFQAAGAFAKYAHKDGHTAKAEFAWSRAIDGDHYASADGGNSYQRMGEDPAQAALDFNGRLYPTQLNPAGAPRTGIAWSLGGKMLAGKWLKRAKKDDAIVETYLRQTTPGFYGGGASLDQGQTRWGLLSSYRLDPRDRASLRYDASYSLVSAPLSLGEFSLPEPAVREYRSIHREALTLRFERKEKRWTAGAQYQLGYTGDSWNYVDAPEGTRADVLSNVIAADGLYRIDKRWSAGGAQKAIISGDDLRFEDPFARFLTTARARFAVDKKLAIELEEELRWNGDNQTRLSLVRRPHPGMEQYVQERLTNQNGGFFNTTVLGAMERKKKSGESARAELHMDHALGSDRMSGVVGLGRRYKLLSGLTLSMNYERFQVLSGGPALSSPQPVTGQAAERGSAGRVVGTSDLVGQPSAPNLGSPLLQSGMNAWGLAPVSGSRDALGFSLRYKKHRKLMITARSELRLELASEAKLE
ncbi:MAG: hypothetical protein OSB21_08255, partial [Myxococcota bacterium]|nr:hypothetical protein [Myxococcota bacterium]